MNSIDKKIFSAKTIAIIGNAEGLIDSSGEIDNFDLVFRLNNGYKLPLDGHRGTKTDFVCTSSIDCALSVKDMNIDFIWMTPKNRENIELFGEINYYPIELWRNLFDKIGSRPSTGIMAIDYVLSKNISAQIKLFGFNFYKTINFNGKGKGFRCPHDFEAEEKIIRDLASENRLEIIEVEKNTNRFYLLKKIFKLI